VYASGAFPESSLTFCTDSLLHKSQAAAAMFPTGLKCAQLADLPSMEIGQPVIALITGPSYAQSFEGPTAPCSNAARLRTALIARTTAAKTSGSIF
jgi:hypothetical protein